MSQATIIIPSRYGSTRFPGKPLAQIAGKTLLERVWSVAKAVPGSPRVVVATDDERIFKHVSGFGAEVVMTSPECRNGSERVLEALKLLKANSEIVLNLQGDAPLVPPWVVAEVIEELVKNPNVSVATPAVQLKATDLESSKESKTEAGGTYVVFDNQRNAMYFSKSRIPYIRSAPDGAAAPVFRHIGLYGYRKAALERYVSLEPGYFEQVEQLEQLRLLENGIPIRVCISDLRGRTLWSVDNPSDADRAAEIISKEGELV